MVAEFVNDAMRRLYLSVRDFTDRPEVREKVAEGWTVQRHITLPDLRLAEMVKPNIVMTVWLEPPLWYGSAMPDSETGPQAEVV